MVIIKTSGYFQYRVFPDEVGKGDTILIPNEVLDRVEKADKEYYECQKILMEKYNEIYSNR